MGTNGSDPHFRTINNSLFFSSQGTREENGLYMLQSGIAVDVVVEYTNTLPPKAGERSNAQPSLMRGVVSSLDFPHPANPVALHFVSNVTRSSV